MPSARTASSDPSATFSSSIDACSKSTFLASAVAALAMAMAIIFAEMSMARMCFTWGAWAMAVPPVPQPISSTSMSGRR
jgi:hypothetical protein